MQDLQDRKQYADYLLQQAHEQHRRICVQSFKYQSAYLRSGMEADRIQWGRWAEADRRAYARTRRRYAAWKAASKAELHAIMHGLYTRLGA
jgi:hypothetical protein